MISFVLSMVSAVPLASPGDGAMERVKDAFA
jgi:hypothetical protein